MADSHNDRKKIASRLKTAREMVGLSQYQVAKLMGLHRPSISEIEAGRRRVAVDELTKFAEIYSVDIEWLTGTDEDSSQDDQRVRFAARELAKLKSDDLDKVMNLLRVLRPTKGQKP
ncbi:MAG: helix-turn-helix transcriptional regulator [Candidatus Auribacterota bacterium]|jgi:transcriptional regulator with XRE-family HTH domain|nr:helix-turn-helix transcriptional regulator [Candidatus Auribacterota bacterium]